MIKRDDLLVELCLLKILNKERDCKLEQKKCTIESSRAETLAHFIMHVKELSLNLLEHLQ